jgi:hypothetical protein
MVFADEATTRQQSRAVAPRQLHDEAFADALAAEGQNVDRSADGPHHLVAEKIGEGRHFADR